MNLIMWINLRRHQCVSKHDAVLLLGYAVILRRATDNYNESESELCEYYSAGT